MHDIFLMDVTKCLDQACKEESGLLLTEALLQILFHSDLLVKVSTIHEIHDKVEVAIILQRVMKLDDEVTLDHTLHEIHLVHQIAHR